MRIFLSLPLEDLARRYVAGESVSALALAYRCSPATVAKRLRGHGVALRPTRYRPVSVARDELERLYIHERLPLLVIATRLGVTVSTVGNKRREYGIPARSNRGRRPKAVEQQRRRELRRPLWYALRG